MTFKEIREWNDSFMKGWFGERMDKVCVLNTYVATLEVG